MNGRIFEVVTARLEHRARCDLYHSALEVRIPEGRYVIEMTPIPDANGAERGVFAEGAVGSRWASRLRIFRYELRCARNGQIPDVSEAVESPRRLTDDPEAARALLELVPYVPTPVWGRDELDAGEMWNSNSVVAWLITSGRLLVENARLPKNGRAPGWYAGVTVALRALVTTDTEGSACRSDSPEARLPRARVG